MNFIYDIVLNFNKDYYDFFEWNKKDNIINIKKIPLFMVSNNTYKTMKYDSVTVGKSFIDCIKDRTYTYNRQKIGPSCLVSNGKEAMGLLFNDKGDLIKKSSLLLDEEEEVLNEIYSDEVFDIEIVKVSKNKREENSSNRIEKEKKDFLIKYISKEKSDVNLKYLYYDYFEKDEDNSTAIKNALINEIKNNWNKNFDKFYETVKIFSKIKN